MRSTILPPTFFRSLAAFLALGLSACELGTSASGFPASGVLGDIYEPVSPAVPAAPFAKVLGDCTFKAGSSESCLLSTLPFLGQETDTVTVDKAMERVAVSHPWMAVRFREVLETQPPELLQMMRPITAIGTAMML